MQICLKCDKKPAVPEEYYCEDCLNERNRENERIKEMCGKSIPANKWEGDRRKGDWENY